MTTSKSSKNGTPKKPDTLNRPPEPPKAPLDVIAEFSQLESARESVLEYFKEHSKIIETYEMLRSEANTKLKNCKSLFASHDSLGDSYCGFSRGSARTVDAKRLIELVPDMLDFVKYSISVEDFDRCVSEGIIDEDYIGEVLGETPRINGPKAM